MVKGDLTQTVEDAMENRTKTPRITPYIFTVLPPRVAGDTYKPSKSASAGAFRSPSSSIGSGKG